MNKIKALLKKLKNKKLRGNISLLVILILLSTSIMALLSINQIQHLMRYGNQTYNYFRAYYLAKAGTQIGLTALYNHEDGFEMSINSGSTIISGNLLGENGEYRGFNPYFTLNLSGNFQYITEDPRIGLCTDDNKIALLPGEGIMLALFKDDKHNNNKTIKELLTDSKSFSNYEDNTIIKFDNKLSQNVTLGLFDEDFSNIHVITDIKLDKILNEYKKETNKSFLTIKNPNDSKESVSFCILGQNLASPNSLITTIGHYGDIEVGLQTVIKKKVPSWALNTLGE